MPLKPPVEFVPICSVCVECKLGEECPLAAMFPAWGCKHFEDGYEGPEYPDGDAYREWVRKTLYGGQDERVG